MVKVNALGFEVQDISAESYRRDAVNMVDAHVKDARVKEHIVWVINEAVKYARRAGQEEGK